MIKNGTTGIGDYSGKFKELCKPCMQAKQRAENHGRAHLRHPQGKPGEHLRSDLAVISTLDFKGNKYGIPALCPPPLLRCAPTIFWPFRWSSFLAVAVSEVTRIGGKF
jgi:hypothetical protein